MKIGTSVEELLAPACETTFESRGRTKHQWSEIFDLGSSYANANMALAVAWKKDARIVGCRYIAREAA